MPRYEVCRIDNDICVEDMRRPIGYRVIATFYGVDAYKNAEAFCFMKNMWGGA